VKKSQRKLQLKRETLRQLRAQILADPELRAAHGGAPTNGANCGFSEPSACTTCLCTR
jgi:hypothetical protein